MLTTLVHAFYAAVRKDPLLGPVFSARISDWDLHLRRMALFWSSVMLATGQYHGQPMQMHMDLPVDARHFDRWLELFRQSAQDVCPPEIAATILARAGLIARSLENGVACAHGVLLGNGARFSNPQIASLPSQSPHPRTPATGQRDTPSDDLRE